MISRIAPADGQKTKHPLLHSGVCTPHTPIHFFVFFFTRFYVLSSFCRDKRWSQVSSLLFPPVLACSFYRAQSSAIPLLVDVFVEYC